MKYFFTLIIVSVSCLCYSQNRTLDFFITQARENSPLIKEYNNQILSYRLDSLILRAFLNPR